MIEAVFKGNQKDTVAYGLWQYDYGQTLRIQGVQLPSTVQVHFALQAIEGEATTEIGTSQNGITEVKIPDALLKQTTEIDIYDRPTYTMYAWVYTTDGKFGKTEYRVIMPISKRAKPKDYDPEEETVTKVFDQIVAKMDASATKAENAANHATETAEEIKADREKITTNEIKIAGLKSDLGNIDYIVFEDKINKLTFNSEGTSSNIALNGNTITSINATKEQYKAFINTSLFEKNKKYKVVTKFTNNSKLSIRVYLNAFGFAFKRNIGMVQGLASGQSAVDVVDYTGEDDIRGFSIYSLQSASYTVEIYVYDVTDKDISNIDFSVGGTKIKILKSDLEKPYFGKILCTYGDSITAQQTWQDYVQRELGFSKYYNHGVGGRRLMAMATDKCLAEITEDFDVILVMGGTNDWAQDRTIGTENDINTDDQTFTGTFYGGLNALIKKLTTKYPTKRIVFMTQTPTKNSNGENFFLKKGSADGLKNSNGDTTRDFAKATLNACGNNHVPCIDLNSLVGWNENNISSFVLNENDMFFHPTSIGGKRMAECISGFLESIQSIN